MNTTVQEGIALAGEVMDALKNTPHNCDVVICTPFTHLMPVAGIIDQNILGLGAENCADHTSGAYTGEVSAQMVASTGANYVILGHSERRQYYGETNETLQSKTRLALDNNLTPIFCVGEVLEERENGTFNEVVKGQVEALFRQIHSSFGGTDILVNNAGVASQKLLMDLSEAEWDRLMDVDLKGVFLCCRAALPYMVSKKHGVIINISSMWGQTGGSCEAAYSAAKAGVIGLTKALAKEMGPSHIRVNCIAPGVIATDMNAALTPADLDALREETPLQALGRPEDVARAALFLASSDAAFITGQVLGVNGGIVM